MEDEEKCLPKKICYRVASHQLWHGSQTLQHCAVCRGPKRGVEPILKMNMICKSKHIAWSKGNSEGWPRKIWKPPFSEKTEPSLTLENNNYCNRIESEITTKQNSNRKRWLALVEVPVKYDFEPLVQSWSCLSLLDPFQWMSPCPCLPDFRYEIWENTC